MDASYWISYAIPNRSTSSEVILNLQKTKLFYIFHTGQIFKLPVTGKEGDSE